MNQCKCGSYALNIAPKSDLCDVCYYKDKLEKIEEVCNSGFNPVLNLAEKIMEIIKRA